MIYLFGVGDSVSVIYKEKFLSPEEKERASLVVEELPEEPEEKENHTICLFLNPETKELSYVYKEIIEPPERKRPRVVETE